MEPASCNRTATIAELDREHVVALKLPGRFAKDQNGVPLKWPSLEGYERYNVCSGARGASRSMSPMILGPIYVEKFTGVKPEDDEGFQKYGVRVPDVAENVENLWQFSKLWPGEEDQDGKPTREWYERRRAGFLQKKGQRHVKKGTGVNRNVPLYSVWGKNKFRYVKARARIYAPVYAALVKETEFYKQLEQKLANGGKILLLDFDAYDKGRKTFYECFDDETKPFGHAFVLASLLLKLDPLPWERPIYTADDSVGEK